METLPGLHPLGGALGTPPQVLANVLATVGTGTQEWTPHSFTSGVAYAAQEGPASFFPFLPSTHNSQRLWRRSTALACSRTVMCGLLEWLPLCPGRSFVFAPGMGPREPGLWCEGPGSFTPEPPVAPVRPGTGPWGSFFPRLATFFCGAPPGRDVPAPSAMFTWVNKDRKTQLQRTALKRKKKQQKPFNT